MSIKSLDALNKYVSGNLGKNLLINGDFSVWQRGESFNAASIYTADRWQVNQTTPTTRVAVGNKDYLEINSSTGYPSLIQRIEGAFKYSGEAVTLSFNWELVSGAVSGQYATFRFTDGGAGRPFTANFPIPEPETPGRKVISLSLLDNAEYGDYLEMFIVATDSATNCVVRYGDIQLELGDTATDFEVVDPATQLARCQRYFYIVNPSTTNFPMYKRDETDTIQIVSISLPTTMRRIPTISSVTLVSGSPVVDSVHPGYLRVYTTTIDSNQGVTGFEADAEI